jgi:hypothetical protein
VLAPWERFVLGVDEALEELGREGAGGLIAPSASPDQADPPPGPGVPAQGGGPGLRSVPASPSDAEGDDADSFTVLGPGSADFGWHAHVFVGMVVGLNGQPTYAHEDVGMATGRANQPRSTPAEAIDAAIGRLGQASTGSDRRAIDPPTPRPSADQPGLASIGLVVSLLARRWGRLRAHFQIQCQAGKPELPRWDRPSRLPAPTDLRPQRCGHPIVNGSSDRGDPV